MRGSPVVLWGWSGFYGGFIYQVKSKRSICYAFWLLMWAILGFLRGCYGVRGRGLRRRVVHEFRLCACRTIRSIDLEAKIAG
jgi:hypothetical protein